MNFSSLIVYTWATHGCTWAHMGENGLHVGWKFFEKCF